jgi:antitoxin MazE
MNVTQSLQKWGNGAGVRIPKKVAEAANIHLSQQLIITLQDNSIVLTPVVEKRKQTLETILKGVSPSMIEGELDWGKDVGAERYE